MRCLTVVQPFAHLIIHGDKRVENRTWPTNHRGRLAIHAGKSRKWLRDLPWDLRSRLPDVDDLEFGAIIGTVNVIDCITIKEYRERFGDDQYACGPWCWVLADPKPLEQIELCLGALSLWTWKV